MASKYIIQGIIISFNEPIGIYSSVNEIFVYTFNFRVKNFHKDMIFITDDQCVLDGHSVNNPNDITCAYFILKLKAVSFLNHDSNRKFKFNI